MSTEMFENIVQQGSGNDTMGEIFLTERYFRLKLQRLTDRLNQPTFYPTPRPKQFTQADREAHTFQYNVGPIQCPLLPLGTIVSGMFEEFQGVPKFGPHNCRETSDSRTVVRLIVVFFSCPTLLYPHFTPHSCAHIIGQAFIHIFY